MSGNMDSWEWSFDVKKEAKKAGLNYEDVPSPSVVWYDFKDTLKRECSDIIFNQESC